MTIDTPSLNGDLTGELTGAQIREAAAAESGLRARDLAEKIGAREAQLVAAQTATGGATRLKASPDDIMPLLTGLGPVMALTRNDSCVIEKDGIYDNFHSGQHASMILNEAIDLRMFPAHWVSAFAVVAEGENGPRRSVQVFDAAGDAVHKVHLRDHSDAAHFDKLVDALAHDDQSDTLAVAPRQPVEAAKGDPAKAETLRTEWAKMTDTHQFMRLTSKLKMNRLGAYRMAGEPMARQLDPSASTQLLETLAGSGVEIMFFVGNRGCIEIHGGPIHKVVQMGPWLNVMDPEFHMHLRTDHIAEVWAVNKPTQRGDAISVETFAADGALIYQCFGRRTEAKDSRPDWAKIVEGLPSATVAEAV